MQGYSGAGWCVPVMWCCATRTCVSGVKREWLLQSDGSRLKEFDSRAAICGGAGSNTDNIAWALFPLDVFRVVSTCFQLATSYYGFKPVHNIIDEKLRMQLDVIRDAAAVVIQKNARRYIVQQRMHQDRWCVLALL